MPIQRAVTGGTGPYASIDGEAEVTFLGFNASEGVNQRIVAELVGVDEEAAAYSLIPIAARTVSPAS